MTQRTIHDVGGILRPKAALIALVLGLGMSVAAAEPPTLRIQLRNGDTVSGRLTSEDSTNIVLRTAWTSNLTIPKAEIVKKDTVPNPPTPTPTPATVAKPAARPTPAKPPMPAEKPPLKSQWALDMEVGADLAFSTRDRSLYNARFRVTQSYGRLRNAAEYRAAYGESKGVLNENRMEGSLKTDVDLNARKMFIYNLAGASYDAVRNLDLRYEIGPGLGYHMFKTPKFTLDLESGGTYEHREFANRSADDHMLLRVAERTTWNITSKFALDQRLEFFPNLEPLGEFRVRFESNLRYSFWKNIYLTLGGIDQWESDPAPGVSQNDLQIRTSLGARF
jgi:putative salt-induced outer membrane protein YdiY